MRDLQRECSNNRCRGRAAQCRQCQPPQGTTTIQCNITLAHPCTLTLYLAPCSNLTASRPHCTTIFLCTRRYQAWSKAAALWTGLWPLIPFLAGPIYITAFPSITRGSRKGQCITWYMPDTLHITDTLCPPHLCLRPTILILLAPHRITVRIHPHPPPHSWWGTWEEEEEEEEEMVSTITSWAHSGMMQLMDRGQGRINWRDTRASLLRQ